MLFQATTKQKNVSLGLSLNGPLRKHYLGDAARLKQVLDSLLSNAFKFTERGAVDLRVSVMDEGAEASVLLSDIIDRAMA